MLSGPFAVNNQYHKLKRPKYFTISRQLIIFVG